MAAHNPQRTRLSIEVEPELRRRITIAEQQRGLQALANLERISSQIFARHGKLTPESWELLNQSREERGGDVGRAIEE